MGMKRLSYGTVTAKARAERVTKGFKYTIILKFQELFYMQKFDTSVSVTKLLSQPGKLLSATPDPSQPLKADPSVPGKQYIKS